MPWFKYQSHSCPAECYCCEGTCSLSTTHEQTLVAQSATQLQVLSSTQAGSWQEKLKLRQAEVWQLEGSLGLHTDDGRMAKGHLIPKALDKWLLTGFCVPQHLAACGPCRNQCTDSLVFLRVSPETAPWQGYQKCSKCKCPETSLFLAVWTENHVQWALVATAQVER